MNINPKNNGKFTSTELGGLFISTIDDIMKRDDNAICDIICMADALKVGSRFQIKKYKGIDNIGYILFDLAIIGENTSNRKQGPIIIDYNEDKTSLVVRSIIETILSTQDICFNSRSKMTLTCDITNSSSSDNVTKGKINNLKNMFEEVYEIIEVNKSRYVELEFILNEPRKSYLLYIYIIRDKHMGLPIYFINVAGGTISNIVSSVEDFRDVFNGWSEKIYGDFNNKSLDPEILVKYYTISEMDQLI